MSREYWNDETLYPVDGWVAEYDEGNGKMFIEPLVGWMKQCCKGDVRFIPVVWDGGLLINPNEATNFTRIYNVSCNSTGMKVPEKDGWNV